MCVKVIANHRCDVFWSVLCS